MNEVIRKKDIESAMSYEAYRNLVTEMFENGSATGGQTDDAMLNYTKLNQHRMKRLDKTTKLNETLIKQVEAVSEKWFWIVLTEGWCGDAAHNIPVIQKMAELNSNIELGFLLRDENLNIMDAYLTNGGRSIPKLICLRQDTLEEVGTWGPRPAPVQKMTLDHKESPKESNQDFSIRVQNWYNGDKSETIQREFESLLKEWTLTKRTESIH
ncbi:thioredoxin family protein [Fulvivirgaceae bacterium BMA10]|uniref:Thioredoxin family protein n=1 Tax=Splendidivirga corallicola TaxID=3051826 RepID=A0ABT8KRP0_9BACT|nr:thioredoxin family protein [Fulvivirgaceae bacterium BMA10]